MNPRRKRARKYINLREKLAAALSMLLPQEQRDELRAAKAPAKTVIGLFDQDHAILHAFDGADRWFNLTPMLRAPHREKSRRDTSIVAKSVRIRADHEEFRRRVLAVEKQPRDRSSRWPRGPKLRSRNDLRRREATTKGESHVC